MGRDAVEIITGHERRRRWSMADKLRIPAECGAPGMRVSEVAARHSGSLRHPQPWHQLESTSWTELASAPSATWPAQGFFWLRRQAVSLICIWCEHEPIIGSSWALGSFFPWSPSGDTLRAGEPPTLTLSRSGTRPARPRCTLRQGRSTTGWRGCTAKLSTGATMSPVASAKVIGHATVTSAGTFVA